MRLWLFCLVVGAVTAKKCSDPDYSCPDTSTCCQLQSGDWGCCPHVDAVCCSDNIHCCPSGSECDIEAGRCTSEFGFPALAKKGNAQKKQKKTVDMEWQETDSNEVTDFGSYLRSLAMKRKIKGKGNEIVCPGGKNTCPDGATCCPSGAAGSFNCCQAPNAVCCSDHKHCCPHGYQCNGHYCFRPESDMVPVLQKFSAAQIKDESRKKDSAPVGIQDENTLMTSSEICPGSQFECPAGLRCCPAEVGRITCCHPEDEKCCAIICPGGKDKCPIGTTCCRSRAAGSFNCCPTDNAVCCSDQRHCCPEGYKCKDNYCSMNQYVVPVLRKFSSTPIKNEVGVPEDSEEDDLILGDDSASVGVQAENPSMTSSEICPGGQYKCPADLTCCPAGGGLFGCCPLKDAVCCADNKRCCPSGYQCNGESCTRQTLSMIPLLRKFFPRYRQPAALLNQIEEDKDGDYEI